MSSDDSPNVPSKRDRREAVREKAQQVQTKQSRLRVLRYALAVTGALVVVGGAAVAVTWALSSSNSRPQLAPASSNEDGFVVNDVTGVADSRSSAAIEGATPSAEGEQPSPAGSPSPSTTAPAPVDIRVYVDYLSTGARDFQLANSAQLTQWVNNDTAELSYHPVAMLTSKSNGTKYSLRAASAAACVATHSPEAFFKYNNALLRSQPDVDSDGLSDEELADLAQGSSVSDPTTVRTCIEEEAFAVWAKGATERALKSIPGADGVALTSPVMVLVNGTPYVGKPDDPKEFQQFVFSVASSSYFKTASPTPAPSASSTPAP